MSRTSTHDGLDLAVLIDDQNERLSLCVHCGFCLPACPTYNRLGDEADSPRGRLHLMRAVVEGRLDPASDAFQQHIDRCLGCRACEPVCPSGVQYGLLLEGARHAATEAKPPALATRALLSVFGSPFLRWLSLTGGRLLRSTRLSALLVRLLPSGGLLGRLRTAFAMLDASAPASLLGPTSGGAPRRDSMVGVANGDATAEPLPALSVAVLDGCVQQGLFNRVNKATQRVLETNGCSVEAANGQGCCGALHAHAGRVEAARELARVNVDAFYPLLERGELDALVVNAAGCGAAMAEYGHLMANDPAYAERAAAVAERVRDVSQVLVERGPKKGAPVALRVAYDSPCHLEHAQGILAQPLAVLDSVPGLERVTLEQSSECCGGAGIYGLTHPELGGRIGGDKVDAVERSGAELLVTGNPGCMMQIGAGLRMRGSAVEVAHPVEVLDRSYRSAGYYDQ